MQARRVTIGKEVRINESLSAEALNLSSTGIFVVCPQPLSQDAPVSVDIKLAGVSFTLSGQVKRVEDGFGFAIRFIDLPQRTADFLDRYVERRAEQRWDEY